MLFDLYNVLEYEALCLLYFLAMEMNSMPALRASFCAKAYERNMHTDFVQSSDVVSEYRGYWSWFPLVDTAGLKLDVAPMARAHLPRVDRSL